MVIFLSFMKPAMFKIEAVPPAQIDPFTHPKVENLKVSNSYLAPVSQPDANLKPNISVFFILCRKQHQQNFSRMYERNYESNWNDTVPDWFLRSLHYDTQITQVNRSLYIWQYSAAFIFHKPSLQKWTGPHLTHSSSRWFYSYLCSQSGDEQKKKKTLPINSRNMSYLEVNICRYVFTQ